MAGEAYIVEAVRTPVGRRGGALSQVHPADLGAHVLTALVERAGIDPATVDDVIFGCVNQVGAQPSIWRGPPGCRPACPRACPG